jgi:hypothetical protein
VCVMCMCTASEIHSYPLVMSELTGEYKNICMKHSVMLDV